MAITLPSQKHSTSKDPITFPLTVADRCDRCMARALVRLIFALSVLDFCGHCYATHAEALAAQDFTVDRDIREEVA